MAAAGRAVLVVKTLLVLVGGLWWWLLERWAMAPLSLLVGGGITVISLGLISMGRGDGLTIEGIQVGVGRIVRKGGIDGLVGRSIGNGGKGRLLWVWWLGIRVGWIGPGLILRRGRRAIERLTRVGLLGEIEMRGIRAIMRINGSRRVELLVAWIRVLVLGVIGG
jgi:hypothetical protein